MKKITLLTLLLFTFSCVFAQVRITEVNVSAQTFTIKNFGTTDANITNWRICSRPAYGLLSNFGMPNPVPAGQSYVVDWILQNEGEVALYIDNQYNNSSSIRDFFKYGNNSSTRLSVAVSAGLWVNGETFDHTISGPWYYNGDGTNAEHGLTFWSETLSTNKFTFDNDLQVFPNPSNDNFSIQSSSFPITKIVAYNILGKIIYNKEMSPVLNTSLNLNAPTGIYLVEIYSGNQKTSKRLVIN